MLMRASVLAVSLVAAASPGWSKTPEPREMATAPTDGPNARYCMRVEPVTGTRVELIRCWTRQEWAEQGVDVDKDWAKEGVAVLR